MICDTPNVLPEMGRHVTNVEVTPSGREGIGSDRLKLFGSDIYEIMFR
jgi:hypothetical protein